MSFPQPPVSLPRYAILVHILYDVQGFVLSYKIHSKHYSHYEKSEEPHKTSNRRRREKMNKRANSKQVKKEQFLQSML